MLPGGRSIGGPLPGRSTSVTGSPSGLDPSTEEDDAALMDDWYESFNELRYGLSQINEAPGRSTKDVCVLGLMFVISVFPSKKDCLISASLLGLICTRVPMF